MDRVNRSLIVASTLLAIPTALLMVSLSTGTTPDVQLAVGQGGDDVNAIEQVVGKQPNTPRTRPGLFQVISGSKSPGNPNHQHENMPKNQPKVTNGSVQSVGIGSVSHSMGSNSALARVIRAVVTLG